MFNQEDWILNHAGHLVSAGLAAFFGYFSPIVGVFGVMTAVILFDLFVGISAARKRGEAIQSKKLWQTIQKLFFAIAVVALLYAVDVELAIIDAHKLVAWLIIGFEMWSILENVGYITDSKAFLKIQEFMRDKVEKTTGVDIKDKEDGKL